MKRLLLSLLISALMPGFLWTQEIKPGLVISKNNVNRYLPQLNDLLFPSNLNTVTNGLKNGWITVPVIKGQKYSVPKGYGAATAKYGGKCRIEPKNELVGWVAGLPFRNPMNGAELAWNVQRRNQVTDQMSVYFNIILFSKEGRKSGNKERGFKWHLYNRYFVGRHTVPPIPEEPGNNGLIRLKECIIVTDPYDVKGFSMIRVSYEAINRPDEVFSYIPAIRRVRRLTGSDVTDPLLGSDACYDDFEIIRQKINSKMTFKILGVKDFLVPRHYTQKPPQPLIIGDCFQLEWEKRSLRILQYNINDSDYAYSTRTIYVEKELPTADLYGGECYDQKGRFWKSCHFVPHAKDAETFDANCWYGAVYNDYISGHSTLMEMDPVFADPKATGEVFSIKNLIREAK